MDASFDAPGFAEVEVHAVCDGEVGVGSAAEDDFVANTGISKMCDVCEEKGGGRTASSSRLSGGPLASF